MKVLFAGGNLNSNKKLNSSKKENITSNNQIEAKKDVLSFMSIPSLAFKGKLVIPVLPEKLISKPQVDLNQGSQPKKMARLNEPVVKYKVNPQDELVTKPEIYTMQGNVSTGPVNDRVEVVRSKRSTKPDKEGNFIFDEASKEFERTNAFVFVNKPLKLYEKTLGRKIHWAFDNKLQVDTRAGDEMNACYNRLDEKISLYYFKNPQNKKETLYTAKMADVITHEAGHAVLDGLKPGYMGWRAAHGVAVHESFADVTSMLVAMSNDNLLDRVIEDTGGNLRKENLIASLAEQMGKAVYGDRMYLRTAQNGLKLSHFTSKKVPGEPHIIGMFFDAIFYDILCGVYKEHSGSMTPKESIRKTRDDLTKLFARAMADFMPPGNVDFFDMFVALIQADKTDFGGKYKPIIVDVLTRREILEKKKEPELNYVPDMRLPFNVNSLSGNKFGMKNEKVTADSIEKFVNSQKQLLNMPEDKNYKLESAYTNDFGETFLHLKSAQKVDLPPVEGERFAIEVFDGLTLAFDKSGKLFYKGVNSTKSEEVAGAVQDCMNNLNLLKQQQDKGGQAGVARVFKMTGDSNVLVKAPVIEDKIESAT